MSDELINDLFVSVKVSVMYNNGHLYSGTFLWNRYKQNLSSWNEKTFCIWYKCLTNCCGFSLCQLICCKQRVFQHWCLCIGLACNRWYLKTIFFVYFDISRKFVKFFSDCQSIFKKTDLQSTCASMKVWIIGKVFSSNSPFIKIIIINKVCYWYNTLKNVVMKYFGREENVFPF